MLFRSPESPVICGARGSFARAAKEHYHESYQHTGVAHGSRPHPSDLGRNRLLAPHCNIGPLTLAASLQESSFAKTANGMRCCRTRWDGHSCPSRFEAIRWRDVNSVRVMLCVLASLHPGVNSCDPCHSTSLSLRHCALGDCRPPPTPSRTARCKAIES